MGKTSTLEEVMRVKIISVEPETSIYETVKVLKDFNIGALTVIKDNKIVGMFSERDLVKKVITEDVDTKNTPVREVMSFPVISALKETTHQEALILMSDNHIRHLPIVDEAGTPVGIVGIRDLLYEIMQNMVEDLLNEEAA